MHFKNGFKFDDDGQPIAARDHRQVVGSNGVTIYTVSCWADGTFSCNCPAWATFKPKKSDNTACLLGAGGKWCKHCALVIAGGGTSIASPATVAVALRSEPVKRARRLIGDEE